MCSRSCAVSDHSPEHAHLLTVHAELFLLQRKMGPELCWPCTPMFVSTPFGTCYLPTWLLPLSAKQRHEREQPSGKTIALQAFTQGSITKITRATWLRHPGEEGPRYMPWWFLTGAKVFVIQGTAKLSAPWCAELTLKARTSW